MLKVGDAAILRLAGTTGGLDGKPGLADNWPVMG
jgi:hypothetical protein